MPWERHFIKPIAPGRGAGDSPFIPASIDGDILCHRDPPAPSGRTCPFRTQTQAIGLAASGLGYARSARWAEQEQIARWAETSRANRPSSPPHPHAPRPRVSASWAETLGSTISEYRRATINAFRSKTSTARFSGTTSLLMMRNTFGIKPSAGESRPNGPTEHSPGLRPQADALGAAFHKTDCARKGRRRFTLHSRVHRRGHFVSSRPSGAPSGRTFPFRTQTQAIGLAASGLGYARSARWAEQEQIARWAETSRANRPSSPPQPHAHRPRPFSARWAETSHGPMARNNIRPILISPSGLRALS